MSTHPVRDFYVQAAEDVFDGGMLQEHMSFPQVIQRVLQKEQRPLTAVEILE